MSNKKERACGVLLHPASFNSPYGIGCFGEEARHALRIFAGAGIKLWQILPLGPTGYGNSPYSALSTFAGNELLIDIREIDGIDLSLYPDCSKDNNARVDYAEVYNLKVPYLKKIAKSYYRRHCGDEDFVTFCNTNNWLEDYALFRALADHFNDTRWFIWEDDLKNRNPQVLEECREKFKEEICVYKTLQFFFFKQWNALHLYANSLGIRIIGDIPFFVSSDSSDAWSHRELFKIDENGVQTYSAGVPPDAFSPTGQLWGNPVYDWVQHKKTNYQWWRERLNFTLSLVDIVRIDHFRGFAACWYTPYGDPTAETGSWVTGPGQDLLQYFKGKPIIAEDLGVITEDVVKLMQDNDLPGMKILQFAFDLQGDGLNTNNWYLPFNFAENCVAYTGTHDNQTSRGWFNYLDGRYKDIVRRFLQCPDEDVVWQMIRALMSSVAKYVIFPVQDIMGLDDGARMNAPGTVGSDNWSYRFNPALLEDWMLGRLSEFIRLYGRR